MDKKENFMSDNALLYRAAIKYYDNRLKRYDIGYGQVVNLMMIHEHPGITMKELSSSGSVDKGTITKSISKLQEIMTTPCPTYVFEESDFNIMRRALKDFFPDKEGFIRDYQNYVNYWNQVFYPQHSDIFHIIYTLQGLRYTAKTGYLLLVHLCYLNRINA